MKLTLIGGGRSPGTPFCRFGAEARGEKGLTEICLQTSTSANSSFSGV